MKIEMIFVYPLMDIVNNETNLFRIIDNDLKETIVIYLVKENNAYSINMINTMTGNVNNIFIAENLAKVDEIITLIKDNKYKIKNNKELCKIEKYILKLLKN